MVIFEEVNSFVKPFYLWKDFPNWYSNNKHRWTKAECGNDAVCACCMCVDKYVSVYMWRAELKISVFYCFPPWLVGWLFLSQAKLAGRGNSRVPPVFASSPGLGLQVATPTLTCYLGAWGRDSGPHACSAGTFSLGESQHLSQWSHPVHSAHSVPPQTPRHPRHHIQHLDTVLLFLENSDYHLSQTCINIHF